MWLVRKKHKVADVLAHEERGNITRLVAAFRGEPQNDADATAVLDTPPA